MLPTVQEGVEWQNWSNRKHREAGNYDGQLENCFLLSNLKLFITLQWPDWELLAVYNTLQKCYNLQFFIAPDVLNEGYTNVVRCIHEPHAHFYACMVLSASIVSVRFYALYKNCIRDSTAGSIGWKRNNVGGLDCYTMFVKVRSLRSTLPALYCNERRLLECAAWSRDLEWPKMRAE